MLSKKDKDEIRTIFQEELRAALWRTVTVECGPRKQGDPEKVIKEEQVHILDFLATYLPRIEAAMRGMQEDVDHAKNDVVNNTKALGVVGQTLIGMESFTMQLGELIENAKVFGLLDDEHIYQGPVRLVEKIKK